MIVSRANVRLGITGALLLMLLGVIHTWRAAPTPATTAAADCVYIDGQWFCD